MTKCTQCQHNKRDHDKDQCTKRNCTCTKFYPKEYKPTTQKDVEVEDGDDEDITREDIGVEEKTSTDQQDSQDDVQEEETMTDTTQTDPTLSSEQIESCEYCTLAQIHTAEELAKRTGLNASALLEIYLRHRSEGHHIGIPQEYLQDKIPEEDRAESEQEQFADVIIDDKHDAQKETPDYQDPNVFYQKMNELGPEKANGIDTALLKRFFNGRGWGIVWFTALIITLLFALYVMNSYNNISDAYNIIAQNLTSCLGRTQLRP